jgi:outer membrane protein TolC
MMTSKWTSVALTAVLLLGSCGGPARGEGTGSLTLGEAITRALEYAPEVREAELELELAELRLGSAVAAIAFPSIALEIRPPELTADGFTSDLTGTLAAGLTLPVGTSSRLSVGIDFAWDADIGALDMPRWSVLFVQSLDFSQPDAASSKVVMQQQAVADAEARLADTRERITLSAVRTYGQLLSSGAAVAQAESGHRQAEEKLEETESLVEASLRGEAALTEARLDVLEAQIRLDEQSASHAMDLEAFARETLGGASRTPRRRSETSCGRPSRACRCARDSAKAAGR